MDRNEALDLLRTGRDGVIKWNQRRREGDAVPDLSLAPLRQVDLLGADLSGTNLAGADLSGTALSQAKLRDSNLQRANLREADLRGADIRRANLDHADLVEADLSVADLSEAHLIGANLAKARLITTDLRGANLSGASLKAATLVETRLTNRANLSGCLVYGVSGWHLELDETTIQSNLVITDLGPTITVDHIEIAQFIYLLLDNQRIRSVVDAITSKIVLVLGRFTPERKRVLDALREGLRRRDFTPVLYDFEKPDSKDNTGTVETLARLARFIVADLTDPSSVPHELATIVPFLRTTPVLPLKLMGSAGYSMFDDLARAYTWVLKTYEYEDDDALMASLPKVILPADAMAEKLRKPSVA
jgi:uncharacterized protein YjbI with pentapeptide repeats